MSNLRAGSKALALNGPCAFHLILFMWLLLCSAQDAPAHWAYEGLRARGLLPLELVTAEMLLQSRKWEHRVDASGASISITLADGRVINNKAVRGTRNRLTYVPLQPLEGAP